MVILQNNSCAQLNIKNGPQLKGKSFGYEKNINGELVFQTGQQGYIEALTDPSYKGQILVLTFPLIGNYGVPDINLKDEFGLNKYLESNKIHVAGLIVQDYTDEYSHFEAIMSLSNWLKSEKVPAIFGVDTRLITKFIRDNGVCLAQFNFGNEFLAWQDLNQINLVELVSTTKIQTFYPKENEELKTKNGEVLTIMIIDIGCKNSQIRNFLNRGCKVILVPFNYNFLDHDTNEYHGLFLSNGPGDPTLLLQLIDNVAKMIKNQIKPIFGICLGHQILSLSSGALTYKMKYGNRGHNIPCKDVFSNRCYITSQNHGYCVDASSLKNGFQQWFINVNDGSNEGIIHSEYPYFSVQFHPEARAGPRETEYLFDEFINVIKNHVDNQIFKTINYDQIEKPNTKKFKKVLILGSGGLSIGQAGEFDYSGSQAIKALKEEGIYVVLINPNIATIQTSKGLADKVYFLPVTPEFVLKVIKEENPDGIYVTFGGQTALNVGIKLKDQFKELGVHVLGTPIDTIIMTEDREMFNNEMLKINERCALSSSAVDLPEALQAIEKIGYPVIIRAAYALGGLGSGFAENEQQFVELCNKAFAASPQILIEKSMKGWKEIEYEVVRDINGNCITVCNMENFDPLGIHTGDSIVVAPSVTLSDDDHQMLRSTALNVIGHLGVIGECNIQYALNPHSKEYCIIEVNARLSRSSALASKATGYPLAFVAAKLGLGIPLNEIINKVTMKTYACFEPSLDYIVVKIPRFDLKKFNRVCSKISSAMKSVGEVMSIGKTFEEAIQKAIRSIDHSFIGFNHNDLVDGIDIDDELQRPTDLRLFALSKAFHMGYSVEKIHNFTQIDKWFLNKLKNIFSLEIELSKFKFLDLPVSILKDAKLLGFSDLHISTILGSTELSIRKSRLNNNIIPHVKQIDTVAGEFPANTNYLYFTFHGSENDISFNDNGIIVLGSGVYRIGSSVEFDWCAVNTVRTLRQNNIKTIMINYNPETVSTDYDEADRLYFENISLETVLDIYTIEKSKGVVISMGGQTANNIALELHRNGVIVLGTSPESIDMAENRHKFSRLCQKIGIDQPKWENLVKHEDALRFCEEVKYPVLVRPSYVLSGAAMNVVFSETDLANYLSQAVKVSKDQPVVISKFIEDAKEIELDAVAFNGKLICHIVCEHVENAGVHSGDATLILPPQDLDPTTVEKIEYVAAKVAMALNITGPFNIQFIAKDNCIKVIECNVRASRSFPFVSKVSGVNLIELATKVMLGLDFIAYPKTCLDNGLVAVKVPQFSFSRLLGADPVLGVEMASTGEVACFGKNKYQAYMKALLSTGFTLPKKNILISLGSYKEKVEFLPYVKKLYKIGFQLFATSGTADFISEHDIPIQVLESFDQNLDKSEFDLNHHLAMNLVDLYINLPSKNRYRRPASYISRGYRSRRLAVDFSIPLITNVKCAKIFVEAICNSEIFSNATIIDYEDWSKTLIQNFDIEKDYISSYPIINLPPLINTTMWLELNTLIKENQLLNLSKECLESGISLTGIAFCYEPLMFDPFIRFFKSFVNQKLYSFVSISFPIQLLTNSSALSYLSFCSTLSYYIKSGEEAKIGDLSNYLKRAPTNLTLITNAKSNNLSTILLLGSLYNIKIHVTDLEDSDLELVILSKNKKMNVTCSTKLENIFIGNDLVKPCWPYINSLEFSINTNNNTKYLLNKLLNLLQLNQISLEEVESKLSNGAVSLLNVDFPFTISTDLEIRNGFNLESGFNSLIHRLAYGNDIIILNDLIYSNIPKVSVLYPSLRPKTIDSIQLKSEILIEKRTEQLSEIVNLTKLSEVDIVDPLKVNLSKVTRKLSPAKKLNISPPKLSSSLKVYNPFYKKHILRSNQFTREDLHIIFELAQELKTQTIDSENLLKGKILCNLFYESSTRTSTSFEAAMIKLGGSVIKIDLNNSSVAKGETLQDTIRCLNMYTDVVVLRHPGIGSVDSAAQVSTCPIINAGDGVGEHPTQALLDIFTIREELGTVNGLVITVLGDLKNGRTVHSLVKMLSNYKVTINYVSPKSLRIPKELIEELRAKGIQQREYEDIHEVIHETDVLYVTRIQKERFKDIDSYEKVKSSFKVNNLLLSLSKSKTIVMHPLPRVDEIDPEIDLDQRVVYFRQMRYGLLVRMALLLMVMRE